jgi:anti-sigma regulatory factor (Ser/Thr protein kinase)
MPDGRLTLRLANRQDELARLTDVVDRFGRDCRLSDDDLHNLHLILDEVVINIMKHAYAGDESRVIDVSLERRGDRLTARVEDDGPPFDPTTAPPPPFDVPIEKRRIGGLGIHIVRTLADTITYRREHERNVLVVERALTPS